MIGPERLYERLKRIIDVSVAAVGLIVLSPMIAVVALVVRRSLGRPVLFSQERPGLYGRPFRILKFRTMREVGIRMEAGRRMTSA